MAARSKAIYALSGLLKHNAPAVAALGFPKVNGWHKLHDALKDPEITIRTKLVFLLNALLIPTTLELKDNPSFPLTQSVPTSGPALHTDDEPRLNDSGPIHPNSHAAFLKNPSRTDTSGITKIALEEQGIIDTLIAALTNKVPDGNQMNVDFEEKTLGLLSTYLISCNGNLSDAQASSLGQWVKANRQHIAEFLSSSEIDALFRRL